MHNADSSGQHERSRYDDVLGAGAFHPEAQACGEFPLSALHERLGKEGGAWRLNAPASERCPFSVFSARRHRQQPALLRYCRYIDIDIYISDIYSSIELQQ